MSTQFRLAGVLLLGCLLLSAQVQAETLAEPSGFSTLATIPALDASRNQVADPISDPAKFYRSRK
jgi:hypothetical protein